MTDESYQAKRNMAAQELARYDLELISVAKMV